MGIDLSTTTIICPRCGSEYSTRRGHFHVCYGQNYKGVGYLPICHKCIATMFDKYLMTCGDARLAMRQICRKLDLYWSDDVFDFVKKRSATKTLVVAYMKRLTGTNYVGKSYDDTLEEEGVLWKFDSNNTQRTPDGVVGADVQAVDGAEAEAEDSVPKEIIDFWGPSYSADMYIELEKRRVYWMRKLKFDDGTELDAGTEALIRQICSLEIDINKERSEGRTPDKLITALNTLLGSAQLKPDQRKDDVSKVDANTPFGVWIKRWENERPIPEVDPSMRDVDGIKKYIATWFHGHLAKMLGLKKAELKLYEEEIARLRVERPEYDDEDDEDLINDFFSEFDSGDQSPVGGDEDDTDEE